MVQTPILPDVLYPDSDGKPMAENTVQYRWIVRLVSNLKRHFRDQAVFVAGDLFWYPVPVNVPPAPCQAPDVMVVMGRPVGDRGSYKQWEEDNIAPQVVFEILSPGNSVREMLNKQTFYQVHGVLEMFFYDPDSHDFWGQVRSQPKDGFVPITGLNFPWTSPTLGIQFSWDEDGLVVSYPDGTRFKDPGEVMDERDQAVADREQAIADREQAMADREKAMSERDQTSQERDRAFAKLRELGLDPEQL